MRIPSKLVKTKDVASTNDIKEIILARISTKQAIIVATISLLSAVAVTGIANLDKIRNTENDKVRSEIIASSEERGYYEGRASLVESAFREAEEMDDNIRRNREKFQELHAKNIGALRKKERLEASKIRTEINELILNSNNRIQELERIRKEFRKGKFRLIPSYSKRHLIIQQQFNNAN